MRGALQPHAVNASRTTPRKPALLKGGMILCWIYAVMLLLTIAMLPMLDEMSRADTRAMQGLPGAAQMEANFLREMRTTSELFFIPLLALSLVVAYGLAKDRHWSRAAMMTLLILGVVLIPPPMASAGMYALSGGVAVFGWWYLYRKGNVAEYYRALKRGTANGN